MIRILKNKAVLSLAIAFLFFVAFANGPTIRPAMAQFGGGGGGCRWTPWTPTPDTPGALVQGYAYSTQPIASAQVTTQNFSGSTNTLGSWMVSGLFYGCIVDVLFKEHVLPAMMLMTEQLSAVGMQQVAAIGTFLDAKHQMETQRLYQQLTAEAHKDYHPSEEICSIGSAMRSLGASSRNSDATALVLSERSLGRQLGNANSNASEGPAEDMGGRLNQFRTRYCDPNDNDGGLASICGNTAVATRNKDIDFARTVGTPMTLNINFADNTLTDDEQDVMALSSNLFSHAVFSRLSPAVLASEANQEEYMNVRSVIAKRSVAEHSFNAILGMKTAGANAAGTAQYMRALLQELGVPASDAQTLIGQNPSYYAQMEVLTKTIFQRPEFFVGLYDKPANVARKGVALQAISLMQDRDLFKSTLRSEAILSLLLEMEIVKLQEEVQNDINPLLATGAKQ